MVLIWMLSSFELSVFSNGKVYDKYGKHIEFYTDVPQILEDLSKQGFKLGIASR